MRRRVLLILKFFRNWKVVNKDKLYSFELRKLKKYFLKSRDFSRIESGFRRKNLALRYLSLKKYLKIVRSLSYRHWLALKYYVKLRNYIWHNKELLLGYNRSLLNHYVMLRKYIKYDKKLFSHVRINSARKLGVKVVRLRGQRLLDWKFRSLARYRYLLKLRSAVKMRFKRKLARARYMRLLSKRRLTPVGQRAFALLCKEKGLCAGRSLLLKKKI